MPSYRNPAEARVKVRALIDMHFNQEQVVNGIRTDVLLTLERGTMMGTVPIQPRAIREAAGPRDDLREIAGFTNLMKELDQIPFHKNKHLKGRTRITGRKLMTNRDVLALWRGQIRFLTIGTEVEIVGVDEERTQSHSTVKS